jgi:hypothetical protein
VGGDKLLDALRGPKPKKHEHKNKKKKFLKKKKKKKKKKVSFGKNDEKMRQEQNEHAC